MDEKEGSNHQNQSERNVQQTPPAIETTNPTANDPTGGKHGSYKEKNWPQRIEAVCAVLLVFITGFYTYYARQQSIAANTAASDATKSLDTLSQQFQMDQRPYITLLGFGTADYITSKPTPPTKGKPIVVSISYKNVGKSQALNAVIHRHILFGKHISEFRPEAPDSGNNSTFTIDPSRDGGYTTAVSVKDTFANESLYLDRASVISWDGSQPIVVFGRISYDDTFGNHYCLPYAVGYVPSGTWAEMGAINGYKTGDLCPKDTKH